MARTCRSPPCIPTASARSSSSCRTTTSQQSYRWARGTVCFAAGTRIQVDAHYDNSAFNPFNPDPDRAVPYGAQTKDEMMFGFFFFFFFFRRGEDLHLRVDPKTGHAIPGK